MSIGFKYFGIVKVLALVAFMLTGASVAAKHLLQDRVSHLGTDDYQVGKSLQPSSDKLFISDIKLPDKLGITFNENPPYFYSDTIQVVVDNWYSGWQNDIEWCLYEKGSDLIIGNLARHGFFENGLRTGATFCGYLCRNDNKPLLTGDYEVQILDKASGEPLSDRYQIVYEAPKLDIIEVTTADYFTANSYWAFRIKVKNNNPYRIAVHNSLTLAAGDSVFDSDVYCLDPYLDYFSKCYEPGEEVTFEYSRPCFPDKKEPTWGLNEFIFKTILNNTGDVSAEVGGEVVSPEDFGFKPIITNKYSFSVPVYKVGETEPYSIFPEVKLENVKPSVYGDTLDISFDLKVVKGAVVSKYSKKVDEDHIESTSVFFFGISKDWNWEICFYPINAEKSDLDEDLDEDFILFEGESRHYHFIARPDPDRYLVRLDVPYVLRVHYYSPSTFGTISDLKQVPSIFSYEYTLDSSSIEDIINDDHSLPIEIYSLNGIKLKDGISSLSPGVYIIKCGEKVNKVIIR